MRTRRRVSLGVARLSPLVRLALLAAGLAHCSSDGTVLGLSDASVDADQQSADRLVPGDDGAAPDAGREDATTRSPLDGAPNGTRGDGAASDAPHLGPPDDGSAAPLLDGGGGASVLQFHNHASRDGVFTDPLLTRTAAASMHLDATFHGALQGNVYAQPLYVENGPGGHGAFFVATESDTVYALDETGAQVWVTTVGSNASRAEKCGNIRPLGITGTPVIDLSRRAIYLDAARPGSNSTTMAEHEIHALSLDTGAELPSGWPVLASSVRSPSLTFNPRPQNQRGALVILGDTLYVPYGGHSADCTDNAGDPYHGWVIGVPLDTPAAAVGWATESIQAGIWAVGGLAADSANLFATTGNASANQLCPSPPPSSPPAGWKQQEAVLRLQPGPVWSGLTTDGFAPLDWPCLDNADQDVGGSNPVLVDVAGGVPSHFVVASGKNGYVYLVDRADLGGVGSEIASMRIMTGEIKGAPAAYTTALGNYVVAYGSAGGVGMGCPVGQSGNLVAVKIAPGTPPTMSVAWCADGMGQGSPIFTTSDGTHDPLVWTLGAGSTQQLHAWDADTGGVVFGGGASGDVAAGFHPFSTLIAVKGRIFAGADDALFAFASQ
jgi:hypothetical protein